MQPPPTPCDALVVASLEPADRFASLQPLRVFPSVAGAAGALSPATRVLVVQLALGFEPCLQTIRSARDRSETLRILAYSTSAADEHQLRALRSAGLDLAIAHRDELVERIHQALRETALIRHLQQAAQQLVGVEGLREAQLLLREAMLREAFDRCGGNKRAAARLLGVTRAAVQKIARNAAELSVHATAPFDAIVPSRATETTDAARVVDA